MIAEQASRIGCFSMVEDITIRKSVLHGFFARQLSREWESNMTNLKIYGIATTILKVMMEIFPSEYRDCVFAGLLDPGDVVEMVMFDLIKMTYDKTEEKHSMRYFFRKVRNH